MLLDFGTEEQKQRHLPAILRGEEIWMQFLSEPSGGSDVAGALTTAVRDGDEWVLNGSKIWTTGAWWSDWGLCLARTNWDVPKHRGLTVFMLPIHQPGIEVHRIEMLNGSREFCQEFLTDVRVPDSDRVGEVDQGWTVGTRWMFHERMPSTRRTSPCPTGAARDGERRDPMLELARDAGRLDDPIARDLIGEARMLDRRGARSTDASLRAWRPGAMSDQAAAIGRLFDGLGRRAAHEHRVRARGRAGAPGDDDGDLGRRRDRLPDAPGRRIGGGTTEMARNVISERVLGMPRERRTTATSRSATSPRAGADHLVGQVARAERPPPRWIRSPVGMALARALRPAPGEPLRVGDRSQRSFPVAPPSTSPRMCRSVSCTSRSAPSTSRRSASTACRPRPTTRTPTRCGRTGKILEEQL